MKTVVFAALIVAAILAAAGLYFRNSTAQRYNVNDSPLGTAEFQRVTLRSLWGDTMSAIAGTLVLPEARSNPTSNRIQVAYGILKTDHPNPPPPVLYLAGGPGASGIDVAKSAYFYLFREMRKVSDVILLDQRGTGRSIPDLQCPNNFALPTDVTRDVERSIADAVMKAAAECGNHFRSHDVNLEAYNSLTIAQDIEDLRAALGYDRLLLFGTSYGTQLAQVYIRLHPDRVAGAIFAGSVAPDLALKSPAAVHTQFEAMADRMREDDKLRKHIPDFVALMEDVHASLREMPQEIKIPLMDAIDENDNGFVRSIFKLRSYIDPYWNLTLTDLHLQMLVQEMIGRDEWIPSLPSFYYQIRQKDLAQVGNMLRNFRRRQLPSGLLIAVNCATSFTVDRQDRAQAEAQHTVLSYYATSFGRERDACDAFGVHPLGEDFLEPITSDVPVLFIAGDLDGRTPLTNVDTLKSRFPNHEVVILHGRGHNGLLDNTSMTAMLEFMKGEPIPVVEAFYDVDFDAPTGYRFEIADSLETTIERSGVAAAIALYHTLKKQDALSDDYVFDFREPSLNRLGYRLFNNGKVDDAIAVFLLNTEEYPKAFNTWDSLAEAYLRKGEVDKASGYYRKSLDLNFFNGNAHKMLREIEAGRTVLPGN